MAVALPSLSAVALPLQTISHCPNTALASVPGPQVSVGAEGGTRHGGGGDGSGVPAHAPSTHSSQHIFSASHSLLYVTPSSQHTGKYSRVHTWDESGTHGLCGGEGGGFV